MEYLIRDCEPKDLGMLIQLCAKHAIYEKAHFDAEGKEDALANVLFLDEPPLKCWMVQVDGSAVGYATYTFDYSTWDAAYFLYLDCLYLDEEYRGNGIGEDILKRLKDVAKK